MRIVSLLPSATEILFALGLGDDVVGVTFECDHPAEARSKRIVSTTALPEGLSPSEIDRVVKERLAAGEDLYRLERDAFRDLDADLIVTQDLCRVCAVATTEVDQALAALGSDATVLTLDPQRLDEVIDSIVLAGAATGRDQQAAALAESLRRRLGAVEARVAAAPRTRVVVVEWTDPPFAAGHWVPDLVTAAGGEEVLGIAGGRSAQVTWDEVAAAEPDVVLVAPCGYRLPGATDVAASALGAGVLPPEVELWSVDADAFVVRPGPRVVDGVELFASVLHPSVCGPPDPSRATRLA